MYNVWIYQKKKPKREIKGKTNSERLYKIKDTITINNKITIHFLHSRHDFLTTLITMSVALENTAHTFSTV